ncbi:MAG: response regulator [Desulfobacterales bacterium]|nr:response regulator [Desulfobacterales bacterium]
MKSGDEAFVFHDEPADEAPAGRRRDPWKIMIVDDEIAVHETTMRVLEDFSFEDRGLRFVSARSAEEAKRLIREHPDVAVILLDVVMETDHAGLALVRHIREKLKNRFARIVLRTGQPGKAPEKRVLIEYDISDYKEKTELTARKLFTTIISSLRSYRDLWIIQKANEELNREIAERKKAEDKMAAVNVCLEELVEERTRALAKTTEEARAANRAKSDFLARMSHEIRTPLNGVIGLTNLLLKSDLTFQQEDYLKKVRQSSVHLLNIINDILDFSRIEEGKLEIEARDFMLNHVIGAVADMAGERSAEKNVELFYVIAKEVPLSLTGDSLRLNQILINLVGNAVKFTRKGEIVLTVQATGEPASENDVELLFSVRDTGIGISADKIETLFQPFTQADGSVTRRYGGAGLGLSICRELVNRMGGRIWVESVEGEGSAFHFTLPFGLQSEEKRRVLLAPEDVRDLKVLVVDDNEAARIIFREMLEAFGSFQITTTDSGENAMEELRRAMSGKPYELVLLDWKMPDMDGFEVARQIGNDPLFKREGAMPRIIMTTMHGREDAYQLAKEEKPGIDIFLHKPVSSSEMFNSVMEAFGRTEALAPRRKTDMEGFGVDVAADIRGARILLAEDNEINRSVAVALLEDAGLITDAAVNGREAVEMLRSGTDDAAPVHDAVLMDIEMPGMDGYEATRIIRGMTGREDLPVIAMTAHAMKGDREKCLDAGMDDYLTKPIDERRLYAVLRKWIKPGKRETPEPFSGRKKPRSGSGAALPDHLPEIDLKRALKRLKGDARLLRMMLGSFLEKHSGAAGEMETLWDEGNPREARKLIHTIKGVAGTLCADGLFTASRDLEAALARKNSRENAREVRPLLEAFAQRLTRFTDALKNLNPENPDEESVAPRGQGRSKEADLTRAGEILTEMIALIEKNRSRGWRLLAPLLSRLPASRFRRERAGLEKAMAALDTERGLVILMKLHRKLKNVHKSPPPASREWRPNAGLIIPLVIFLLI